MKDKWKGGRKERERGVGNNENELLNNYVSPSPFFEQSFNPNCFFLVYLSYSLNNILEKKMYICNFRAVHSFNVKEKSKGRIRVA